MNYEIAPAVYGQRLNVTLPNHQILQELGEEGMRNLISRHYDLMVESEIKELFPPVGELLELAKKHSADFFIQICGGPRYFDQSRGAPRMVARHMPFRIDSNARLVWLDTFATSIEETKLSEESKESFWNYINMFSSWMVNTPDGAPKNPHFRL